MSDTTHPTRRHFPPMTSPFTKSRLFVAMVSLLFAGITALNLTCDPTLDSLERDNQLYAMLAYNVAAGHGFSTAPIADCGNQQLTPVQLQETLANYQGVFSPSSARSPLGPMLFAGFVRVCGMDLTRSMLWYNFVGLWVLGVLILLLCTNAGWSLRTGTFILLLNFLILPYGYTTWYPILTVNILLSGIILITHHWVRTKQHRYAIICGICTGLLVLTRSHFTLLPLIILPLVWAMGRLPLRKMVFQAVLFCIPLLILYASWVIRNGIVMHDWAFEPRGVIHLFYRMYPNGTGSDPFVPPEQFVAGIEETIGPLPAAVKSRLEFKTDCTPRNPPTIYVIPRELRAPALKAAVVLATSHPGSYVAETFRRLHGYLNYQSPAYGTSRPLLGNSSMQSVAAQLKITAICKAVGFPLYWYNLIFLCGCVAALVLWRVRGRGTVVPALCMIMPVYNAVVLTALSDAGAGYLCFAWVPALVIAGWAYASLLRFMYRRARRLISAIVAPHRMD